MIRQLFGRLYQIASTSLGIGLLLYGLWRRICRARAHVVVLGYHSVSNSDLHIAMPVQDFRRQMRWLWSRRIPVLTLEQLEDYRANGLAISRDAVVITFDDGFEDNWIYVRPLLKGYGMAATYFIPTGHVGKPYTWDSDSKETGYRVMSWAQIRSCIQDGGQIGSHTVSHRNLGRLSSDEILRELSESAAAIASHLGGKPTSMAYPYGDTGDKEQMMSALERSGYRLAFTTRSGVVLQGQNPYLLPRYMLDQFSGRDPFSSFVLYLTCLYGTFQHYELLASHMRRIKRHLCGSRRGI